MLSPLNPDQFTRQKLGEQEGYIPVEINIQIMSQQGAKDTKSITTKKGGSGTHPSGNVSSNLTTKVKEVSNITGWPDEDIKRVLEKHNYDTQITIEAILDGREGVPGWTEVQKKAKQEPKPKPAPAENRRNERGDRGEQGDGVRKPRKADSSHRPNGDGDRGNRSDARRPQGKPFTDSPRGPRNSKANGAPAGHGPHAPGAQAQGNVPAQPQAHPPQVHAPLQSNAQGQPQQPARPTQPAPVSVPVSSSAPQGLLYSKVVQGHFQQPAQQAGSPQSQPHQPSPPQTQQHPESNRSEPSRGGPYQAAPKHRPGSGVGAAWQVKEPEKVSSTPATVPPTQPAHTQPGHAHVSAQAPVAISSAPTPTAQVPISAPAPVTVPAPAPVQAPAPAPATASVHPPTQAPVVPPTVVPSSLPAAAAPAQQPVKTYSQPIQAPSQVFTPPAKRHSQFDGPLVLPQRSSVTGVEINLTTFQFGSLNLGNVKKDDAEHAVQAPHQAHPTQHHTHPTQQVPGQHDIRSQPHTQPPAQVPVHSVDPTHQHHILSNPEDIHSQIPYSYPYPGYIVPPMTHFPGFPADADTDPRLRQPVNYYDPSGAYQYPRTGSPASDAQKFTPKYNGTNAQTSYRDSSKFTQQEGQGTQSSLSQQNAPQSPPPQSPPQYPPPGTSYGTQPMYYPYVQQYPYQNQSQYPYNYYKPGFNFPASGYPTRPHSTTTQGQSYGEEGANLYVQHPYSFYMPATHDATGVQQPQQSQQQPIQQGTGKAPNQLASSPPSATTTKPSGTAYSSNTPASSDYKGSTTSDYSAKFGHHQQHGTTGARTDSSSFYGQPQQQYTATQYGQPPFFGGPQQGATSGGYHHVPAQQATGTTQAPATHSQGRQYNQQTSL